MAVGAFAIYLWLALYIIAKKAEEISAENNVYLQ